MNPGQPLWMPRGSIRALIAILLVVTAMYLVVTGRTLEDGFLGLVVAAVTFYFSQRANEDETEAVVARALRANELERPSP